MSDFTISYASPGRIQLAGRAAAWGGFYASPPAKNDAAMMMTSRNRFAFENGLLMDALAQLAAARSMYIASGMHPAWRQPSNSLMDIAPVVNPASPVKPAREHPANDRPNERKPELASPVTTAKPTAAKRVAGRSIEVVCNAEGIEDEIPRALQAHYSIAEIALLWNTGVDFVRDLFKNQPDVLRVLRPETSGKRSYCTMRISQSTLDRVYLECSSVVHPKSCASSRRARLGGSSPRANKNPASS